MPQALYFMGFKPLLEDGIQWSDKRCLCSSKANLRAVIVDGAITHAGCPVCSREYLYEVVKEHGKGCVLFFSPGTVVVI